MAGIHNVPLKFSGRMPVQRRSNSDNLNVIYFLNECVMK
jgi:hypothetical protein